MASYMYNKSYFLLSVLIFEAVEFVSVFKWFFFLCENSVFIVYTCCDLKATLVLFFLFSKFSVVSDKQGVMSPLLPHRLPTTLPLPHRQDCPERHVYFVLGCPKDGGNRAGWLFLPFNFGSSSLNFSQEMLHIFSEVFAH